MNIDTYEIERVRNNIAGVIYNDCLPTGLVTNTLKDICFHYDNYRKAKDTDKRAQSIEAIRAGIDMINLQNINSGAKYNVLYPTDNSDASIVRMGNAIATIYAIPYQSNTNIDYVGYAYGMVMQKQKNNKAYDRYRPNEFINQCSSISLEHDNSIAKSIMTTMVNCAGAVNYLKKVESGELTGTISGLQNLVKSKFDLIASEIEALTGHKVNADYNMAESLYISSCINASMTFGNRDNIDKFREDGIFKDNRAYDMTIAG
jgi:hypothetical protein